MKNETETLNTVNNLNEDQIPPEYQNTIDHPLSLGVFAETVTADSIPFLMMRLAKESNEKNIQLAIITEAANTLNTTVVELWQEFQKYQNSQSVKENSINKQGNFRFLSVSELFAMSHSTDWLIKTFLDKGSLAMLFGKSGTLKSFAAIDMGLCVATGYEWHGNPVARGTVFYICGEGHKGISRRLKAWELHYSINLPKVGFFISDRPAQFLNKESALEVVAAVNSLNDQYGKPALIIIDTLNRNFGSGDESNTADMTNFVNVIDSSLRHQYGCTVLIVHHTGLKDQGRARGAYSLHAALDWVYKADRHDNILTLHNSKAKDFEQLPPVNFIPEIITLEEMEEDGSPMTSLILRTTADKVRKNRPLHGAKKIAYDVLMDGVSKNAGKPIDIVIWREAAYRAGISQTDTPSAKQKAFNRAKDNLQQMGLVETNNDQWNPIQTALDTGHKTDIQGTLSGDIDTDRQGHPP